MFFIFAIVWHVFGSSEVQAWDSYWTNEKYEYLQNIEDKEESQDIAK